MNGVVTIRVLDGPSAWVVTDALADILIDCVERGASVSFMSPLTRERAEAFWAGVAESVARDERILLIAEVEGELVGTVQVVFAREENQPHRADVAKVLVHSRARRRGVAERLMRAAEDAARAADKTMLVLDAVTGGDAERLYARIGWTKVGVIPNFALFPDGRPCDTTYFFKAIEP